MNKFKKILLSTLSVLTLGLFVGTGAKVNAQTNDFYNAGTDETESYESDETIKSDNMLEMISFGSTSTVSNGFLHGDYTKSLHYDAGSNATHGIKFVNKSTTKDLVITVAIASYDGNNKVTTNPIRFSTDGTLSNQIGTSSKTEAVIVSASLEANSQGTSSGVLCCCDEKTDGTATNSRRIAIYEVSYTFVGDNDKQINFYDGENKLATKIYEFGETINYIPATTPVNYKFVGWFEDSNLTKPLSSTTVSSTTVNTLYAKWDMYGTYLDSSNMVGDGTAVTLDYACDTIFNIRNVKIESNSGKVMPNTGNNCAYRLNPNGQSSSTTNKVISFVAPYTSTLVIYSASTSSGRTLHVCEDEFSKNTTDGIYSLTYSNSDLQTSFVEVTAGKTYYVCVGGSSVWIYGLYLGLNNSVNSTINCQYNDDTNPTQMRMMGTITGLSAANDYNLITDAVFTFKVDGVSKTASCTKLYKSVGIHSLASGTYKLYVVLNVKNIGSHLGKEITDLTLTLTFSDGTTKTAEHADFTLGETE